MKQQEQNNQASPSQKQTSKTNEFFQLTAKIHPFTTFCEGIPDIEAGYNYYKRLYKRNYKQLLPSDKNAKILIVSAGVGYFVTFLEQMGYRKVTGIDSEREKIDYAKTKGIDILHENAFDYLEEADCIFDLILFEQEINHLTKDELVIILTRTRKRLQENGSIILNSTNYANPITAIDHMAHNFNHFAGYTENSIEQVLNYCGFGDVKCYPIDNYVFYMNPLNWIAKAITSIFSLSFIIIYKMYGKSGNLFTKRIIGMGRATHDPAE